LLEIGVEVLFWVELRAITGQVEQLNPIFPLNDPSLTLGAFNFFRNVMNKIFTKMLLAAASALCFSAALAESPGHKHHHDFPKDIDAFHAVLAPIWHARPGKERSRNACAKAAEMEKLARGIQSSNATALVATITVLESKCKGKLADVDAAFFDVHEAFHHLIDAPAPAAKP
jgi:hypothetical protein